MTIKQIQVKRRTQDKTTASDEQSRMLRNFHLVNAIIGGLTSSFLELSAELKIQQELTIAIDNYADLWCGGHFFGICSNERKAEEIAANGVVPIVVSGSGLYTQNELGFYIFTEQGAKMILAAILATLKIKK
jgi:hypothetical protein